MVLALRSKVCWHHVIADFSQWCLQINQEVIESDVLSFAKFSFDSFWHHMIHIWLAVVSKGALKKKNMNPDGFFRYSIVTLLIHMFLKNIVLTLANIFFYFFFTYLFDWSLGECRWAFSKVGNAVRERGVTGVCCTAYNGLVLSFTFIFDSFKNGAFAETKLNSLAAYFLYTLPKGERICILLICLQYPEKSFRSVPYFEST